MANIAPWWHPIRLAEDLAILDNMTGGRVEVGFGRGIWPYEGPQFHPNADPRKDVENRELFRETIEIVREIWSNEYFSYDGANYSFPAEGTVFSHPQYPPNPDWQVGESVTKLRVTPETPPEAAPSTMDDSLHRPLRDDRSRNGSEGLLLAASRSQNQAADGSLRPGQD